MKNYYLRRIDELKVDVTSEKPSKSVKTMLQAALGPLIPKTARAVTGFRKKLADKRQERIEAARERMQSRFNTPPKNKPRTPNRPPGLTQSQLLALQGRTVNSSTTYIQIGYILAESMGLIEEGIISKLARGVKRVAVGTPTRYRPGDIKIQPRYDKRSGLMTNDEEPIEKGKAGALTMLRNLKNDVPIKTPPKRTPKEDEEFNRTRDLLWRMERQNIVRHHDQRTRQGKNDRYDDLGRIKPGK